MRRFSSPTASVIMAGKFSAQVGGVVGELDQMTAPFLENLESKAVLAGVRDESCHASG